MRVRVVGPGGIRLGDLGVGVGALVCVWVWFLDVL